MILEYEGTDITRLVTLSRCVWDAREEGRLPQLSIGFDDGQGLWDSWAPKAGDRISVSTQGASATGAMYVADISPVSGGYELRADPLPIPDAPAVRTWRSSTFSAVVEQLAAALGLTAQFHGCDDMALAYVRQDGEGALRVIARICALAGCTFDVYDGIMHVCARSWVESQESAGLLEVSASANYSYKRQRAYTACNLKQTAIQGVRPEIEASCGTSGNVLTMELDGRVGVPGSSELERACAGVLGCANARRSVGHVGADSLSPFSPGAVCTVSCAKAPSLSGAAVITRVRNDFVNTKSKTWWRQL